MSRPQLGNLSPGGSINTTGSFDHTGNPLLDPFRATTLDAASNNFAPESLIAIGLFYRISKPSSRR